MILMENQARDCVYQDESGAPPSHYIGRLTNVGANIGISGPGELVPMRWAVHHWQARSLTCSSADCVSA